MKVLLELTWVNVVGVSAVCVGGWINRRGFRLDVMMQSRKKWGNSSPPAPTVSTVNIWKWERDDVLRVWNQNTPSLCSSLHTLSCCDSKALSQPSCQVQFHSVLFYTLEESFWHLQCLNLWMITIRDGHLKILIGHQEKLMIHYQLIHIF